MNHPIGRTIRILRNMNRNPRRRVEAPSGFIFPKNLPTPKREDNINRNGEKNGKIKRPSSIAALKP